MLISKKLGFLVGLAMAICAAVSAIGVYGLRGVNLNMVEIADNSVPNLLRVSDMRTQYLASIPMLYNRASTDDAEKGAALEKQMEASYQNLLKQVTTLKDVKLGLLLPDMTVNYRPDDYYPIRQARLVKFDGKSWVPMSELITVER